MELEHYGTKGQKWGERHYQYEDGTLTPEGKERYSRHYNTAKMKKKELKALRKEYGAISRQLSDEELKKLVTRMNLEKQYRELAGLQQQSNGEKIAEKIKGKFQELLVNQIGDIAKTGIDKTKKAAIEAYLNSRGKSSTK